MEVAGQWRREWVGTAEYGKVTEGGVTRRVARAMEVLHASGPGARVRVLRAAYHSTAGAGAPAESFVMHSSRRVISSASNFLDSPTFTSKRFEIPSKPFEISSTPLETTPERFAESENYKVTEPDDSEISEPSKWRSSTGTTLRIPSEESSSTADNVSIIDLDTKMNITKHTDLLRKFSFDSDSSEVQPKSSYRRNSTRASPILDPPVTLSTLKYKSLLNGSNDSWNDRRKSYSFEDTSPLNETILHKNDTFAMESSTDSGICKSTEIVNESADERVHHIHINKTEEMYEPREGTFKDWLARNRHYKETPSKSYRDNYIIEDPLEDNKYLQPAGKVSIALSVNNQMDDEFQYIKDHFHSEVDKRIKKVGFCKTELHFAAETGKVNIIATDEKPPPTSDFRRRRSAFVPIKSSFDKPVVTLFGEKLESCPFASEPDSNDNCEVGDSDENTAATKSILKNKIPKPKPYLLGENMVFGEDRSESNVTSKEYIIPTAVSLINKQLQPEEKRTEEISSLSNNKSRSKIDTHNPASVLVTVSRPINEGPLYDDAVNNTENRYFQRFKSGRSSFREDYKNNYKEGIETNNTNFVKQKLRTFQTSPVMQVKPKTRNLRENELTYFGVGSLKKNQVEPKEEKTTWLYNSRKMPLKVDNDLLSVKLIKRISNSVCNSETESDDTPEYQNLPLRNDFAPVPIPKIRTKGVNGFKIKPFDEDRSERVVIIKPTVEQGIQIRDTNMDQETRRTIHRRQDITTTTSKSRSISEPPKYRLGKDTLPKKICQDQKSILDTSNDAVFSPQPILSIKRNVEKIAPLKYLNEQEKPEEEALYENVNINKEENLNKHKNSLKKTPEPRSRSRQRKSSASRRSKEVRTIETDSNNKKDKDSIKSSSHKKSMEKHSETNKNKTDTHSANKPMNSLHKKNKRISPVEIQEIMCKKSDKFSLRDSKRHVSGSEHIPTPTDSHEKRKDYKLEPRSKRSNQSYEKSLDREVKLEKPKPHIRDRSKSIDILGSKQENIKTSERHHHKRSNQINDKSLDREVNLEKPKPHIRDRSKSIDILGSKQENKNTSERHHHSQTRTSKLNGVDSNTSSKDKRSEFVINYDDKNGTVSSICKVKPGTSKKMIIHPEKTKESKSKTKSSDKTHHK